jgi:inosine/xanthosine triphosphatase
LNNPCQMKKIVVASQNPIKVNAVQNGFERMFPREVFSVSTVIVPSGVCAQPLSDAETQTGALTRARNAAQIVKDADYWVGVEGGIEDVNGEMTAFAWIVVISEDLIGKGRTGTFFLPSRVSELIREGLELGEADDIVFKRLNSKQNNGAIGILTGNVIDRANLYEHGVVMSLVPFKNSDLYFPQTEKN